MIKYLITVFSTSLVLGRVLPRRTPRKRCIRYDNSFCSSICLSVCPFVTLVTPVKMAKRIIRHYSSFDCHRSGVYASMIEHSGEISTAMPSTRFSTGQRDSRCFQLAYARLLLNEIGKRISFNTGEIRETTQTSFLSQRVSVLEQCFNAILLDNSRPAAGYMDWVGLSYRRFSSCINNNNNNNNNNNSHSNNNNITCFFQCLRPFWELSTRAENNNNN